jgi:hypothetical protein
VILELPAPLRPWESELARLPRDLALSIGPQVARLALAIGPLPATRTGGDGEPDGYGGLSRRGRYERLLMGEWALAELWPEEFDRRAAAGEHAFLELARHSSAGARRSVLLLDAGPEQLGGPRIAHLAALVAFARRAHAAGAELRWGVLQRLAGDLHAGLDEAGISALLEARSAYQASPALIEAWIERVQPAADDDLWLVGPSPIAAVAARAGASALVIEDVVAPGVRRLRAEVMRAGRAPVALELALPPPEACARLLRDPYATAVAPRASSGVRVNLSLPVRFSADGRRVIVFDDQGGFLAWPIPSSPRARPGKMRRFRVPPGRRLRAAGTVARRLLAVTEGQAGDLQVHGAGPRARSLALWSAGDEPPGLPDGDAPGSCAVVPVSAHRERGALVIGGAGELWISDPIAGDEGPISLTPVQPQGLAAWAAHAGGLTAVTTLGGGYAVRFVQDGRDLAITTIPGSGPFAAFIGHDPRAYPTAAPIAGRSGPGQWYVLRGDGSLIERAVPPGMKVFGVATLDRFVGLLVTDRLDRAVGLAVPGQVIELARAGGAIASACASSARSQVAYLTRDGELVVLSLTYRAPVLRVRAEVAG